MYRSENDSEIIHSLSHLVIRSLHIALERRSCFLGGAGNGVGAMADEPLT